MHALLNQLAEIVPPPEQPLILSQQTESITGLNLKLPDDYLEFMKVYGPGRFGSERVPGFLRIDVIMNSLGDDSDAYSMFCAGREAYKDSLQRNFSDWTPSMFFLRLGDDDDGIGYGWVIDTSSNGWVGAAEAESSVYPCDFTMLELLSRLFRHGSPIVECPSGYCDAPLYWPATFKRYPLSVNGPK